MSAHTQDSIWKQAARYGDADAEEHGLEAAIEKQGIDMEAFRHIADQRALRVVLMMRPGFSPNVLDQPFAVALDPYERAAHVKFMAAYFDGMYVGWRARGLADGDRARPAEARLADEADIGMLASYARTALTEVPPNENPGPPVETPAELARWAEAEREANRSEKGDVSDWMSTADAYVLSCLDAIIAVTDPVDDERETERCADSLEALGRNIERIREQFGGEAVLRNRAYFYNDEREQASDAVTRALDTLDEAISVLRGIAAAEKADEEGEGT